MYFDSKKTSQVILGITSLVLSRAMFLFFNDPEGPNLLVVMVMGVIVYFLSFAIYTYFPLKKQDGLKKLFSLIVIQIIVVTVFYFCLNL